MAKQLTKQQRRKNMDEWRARQQQKRVFKGIEKNNDYKKMLIELERADIERKLRNRHKKEDEELELPEIYLKQLRKPKKQRNINKKKFTKRHDNKPTIHQKEISKKFVTELIERATKHELILKERLIKSGINHEFQYPIYLKDRFYIADFFIKNGNRKIIIELDGGQHYTPEGRAKDLERDRLLKKAGYGTLRFKNSQIKERRMDEVMDRIMKFCGFTLK